MRLQEAEALAFLAPGAADHLMQQLERALGRARIAVAETEIGIDDADQVELREMVALGDQLGADDDVEAALGDVVEFLAQPLDRFDQVAGQHQDAAAGEQLGRLLLQPLDAGPTATKQSSPGISGTAPAAASRSRNDGRRAGA